MSDLLVKVALDESGVESQLKGIMGKFRNAAKAMAAVTVPAAAVLGIVKSVDALAALGEQAIRSAGDLQDAAEQIGTTAERLQELRILGKQAGVEFAQMDKSLAILNRTVGQAALGQGTFEKTLEAAGISLRTSEGKIKSVSQVYDDLSEAVRSGSLTQAQSVALASAAFGREGGKMVNVLRMTADEQKRVIDTAREYGAILSNDVVRAADEYADKLDLIQQGTQALDTQNKLLLAPLTLRWSELKNEIAGAVAELSRASGLIDDNVMLQRRRLKGIERQIQQLRDAEKFTGKNQSTDNQLELLNAQWEDLATSIAAAEEAARQAAAEIAPTVGVDEESDAVESDSDRAKAQRAREKAEKEAAEATLDLATAVAEERERIAQLEVEQTTEWQNVLAEERERFYVEELAQQQSWADVLAEERDKANADELDQMLQHQTLLTQAAREGAEARKSFEVMTSGQKVATVLGDLETMTAGIAQHSKKAFKINQAAAIGNAVINTAQGVTKALASYPPPISFAMAAAQAAAGAAQIAAIKSTKFEGGGHGTTPGAAGSTPTVNDSPTGGAQTQRLLVEGISSDALFSGGAVRDLAERLLQFQKDGGQVVLK